MFTNNNHLHGSTLNIMYTFKYMYGESPNTDANVPTINMILQPFYLLDYKNSYVYMSSANINIESSKIKAKLSLK